jgi:UDP-N-acetylmuramate: L-alanyl-gamma-D-glutamyl-meso-diaminopimelate ligase
MDAADLPIVYFSHHAVALKRLPELTSDDISRAYADARLRIYNDSEKLLEHLAAIDYHGKNLLLMSSGNFDGLDMEGLAGRLVE